VFLLLGLIDASFIIGVGLALLVRHSATRCSPSSFIDAGLRSTRPVRETGMNINVTMFAQAVVFACLHLVHDAASSGRRCCRPSRHGRKSIADGLAAAGEAAARALAASTASGRMSR
jgi:hypothetical protein